MELRAFELRAFEPRDIPALQVALATDTFHPGVWKVEHFTHPTVCSEIVEDSAGIAIFALYERESAETLRLSCVWADGNDSKRNAKAIIFGIHSLVQKARAAQYKEIVTESEHAPLRAFLSKVLGFAPKLGSTKDLILVL
jgi:hypothetical protein